QEAAKRIDLEIPDNVFQFGLVNNGAKRISAARDYRNEWIYFTYSVPSNPGNPDLTPPFTSFPTQTLLYNYRDDSWAILDEIFTTYGQFRKQTGYTWATIGSVYPTWASWTTPWRSGQSTLL